MAPYTKPYLSPPAQLALLKTRGLQVTDDADALECLRRNGYYRLSAYWFPFRIREAITGKPTDAFLIGSTFEDAVDLYRFDKKFKLVLLDALERVEIAVRVEIALVLGLRDTFAHTKPSLFRPNFSPSGSRGNEYPQWIAKFNTLYDHSRAEFITHHKLKYGRSSPLPIWIAIELWDFGMLAYAFSGMQHRDQVAVSNHFGVPDWQVMASWLQRLNHVRNVIAHHGRLWNLDLGRPKLPRPRALPDLDSLLALPLSHPRIYTICCILCYLTKNINPKSAWIGELRQQIKAFPVMPHASIQDMGFPTNWESQSLWR